MPSTTVHVLGYDDFSIEVSWQSGEEPIDNAKLTNELGGIALVSRTYGDASMIIDLDHGVDHTQAIAALRGHGYDVGEPVLL